MLSSHQSSAVVWRCSFCPQAEHCSDLTTLVGCQQSAPRRVPSCEGAGEAQKVTAPGHGIIPTTPSTRLYSPLMKTTTYPKIIIHRLGSRPAAPVRPWQKLWQRLSGLTFPPQAMKFPLLLLLLLAAAPVARAAPYTIRPLPAGFDAPANGLSGTRNIAPIAADFIGNGRLQWYQGGNVISRFPEAGVLTLPTVTLPQTPTATAVPLAAAVCDVDRDGDMDIVRINEWNGNLHEYTLQVFLNNGSGTFTLGSRVDWTNSPAYNEGEHYLSIVPADYNKDGDVDLAILETYQYVNATTNPDREEGKLYIRRNDGTGAFPNTYTVQSVGFPSNCHISTADYDRDGDPDLMCSDYTTFEADVNFPFTRDVFHRSLLFSNNGSNGNGTFTNTDKFTEVMPWQFVDLNGDGWADLADVSHQAINNRDGTFGTVTSTTVNSSASVYAVLDSGPSPSLVITLPGGIVKDPQTTRILATLPANVDGIGAADSDRDGDTDLFVSMTNGTFALLENRQTQTLPGAELATSVALSGITSLGSADFNLDGKDDLIALSPSQEKLFISYAQATGAPATPVFKSTQNESAGSVVIADFDQDGRPDVAYTLPAIGSVRVARNNGNIPVLWADSAIATGLTGVSLLATGNLGTPNGEPDLFTCSGTTGQIRGLYQIGGTWTGQNILAPISPIPQSLAVGQSSTAAGDEVAFLSASASSLTLRGAHLNPSWTTLGGTGQTETVTGGQHTAKVIWADATGAGNKEAIYINGTGGLSAWIPSIFTSISLGSASSAIRDIAAVDWDHDGRTDILAATATGLTLFHYQRATQQWTTTDLYSSSGGYSLVTIMDLKIDNTQFSTDGYPDAVAYSTAGRLDYIHNLHYFLKADLSAQPAAVTVAAGQSSIALVLPLKAAGRPAQNGSLADELPGVTSCSLRFQLANSGPNGTWIPGEIMDGSELPDFVTSVSLTANGSTVVSSQSQAATSNGFLNMEYNNSSVLAPVAPGATVPHSLVLNIPLSALQQPIPRFFVNVLDVNSQQLDGPIDARFGIPSLLTGSQPILVTIITPLQQWRKAYFNTIDATGPAANDADPDGDGVPNLMEYVMGRNPKASIGINEGTPAITLVNNGLNSAMQVQLKLLTTYDSKVRLTLQLSTTLQSWPTLSLRDGTAAWTGTQPTTSALSGGRTQFTFNTGVIPATTRKAFFRLKAEELP